MNVTDLSKFDSYRTNLLVAKIKNIKSDFDGDIVNKNGFHLGRRYHDNDRIARIILGDIYAESQYNYETANERFIALSSTDIVPYIKKAVLDSAAADYYYNFEKEYT